MNTQEHKTRKRRFWSFSLTLVFLLCSVMPMTALAVTDYRFATSDNVLSTNTMLYPDDTISAGSSHKFSIKYFESSNHLLSSEGLDGDLTVDSGNDEKYKIKDYSGDGGAGGSSAKQKNFYGWKITKCESSSTTSDDYTTVTSGSLEVTAVFKPVITGSVARNSVSQATVTFNSDKPISSYYYTVLEKDGTTPGVDTILNESNSSNWTNTETNPRTVTLTIKSSNDDTWTNTTEKDVYIMVKDADGVASNLLKLTIPDLPNVIVSPSTLTFNTTAGSAGTSRDVTVTNNTGKTLYLTAAYTTTNNNAPNGLYTFTWANNAASVSSNASTTLTVRSSSVSTPGDYGGTISIHYTEEAPSDDSTDDDTTPTETPNGDATTQSLSLLNLNSSISTLDDSEGGSADTTISGSTSINVTFIVNPAGGGGGGGGSSSTTKYTLTYDTNGGEDMKATRHEKNTTVNLSKKIPTRDGYTFVGWFADEALTEPIDSVKMTKNTTVYAAWSGGDNPLNPDDPNGNGGGNGVPGALNGKDHIAYMNGYEDGTIKPNQNITRAEAATLFFRMLNEDVRTANYSTVSPFTDVNEGDWFNIAVATMAKMGILKGRTADTYAPNEPITRAEFATICARFDTSNPDTGEVGFTDLTGHWAEADVLRAAALGWVEGYEDGTFRPDAFITRAEVITMMNRLLCRLPETVEDLLEGMKTWPDVAETDWFYLAIQEATNGHTYLYKDKENHERWLELTDNTEPGENM